ncbi:MAG: cytochrome ubiquinol oxidase subunit I [Desulfovibrionaceae bacterium]
MEYPIWQLTTLGGGFWIAFIATIHVFVAQFAVGGGLFLVLTEHYAYKKNSPAILEYVKKHSKFFLLLTMVFGGVTGVGIWFTIALLSPQATITLIHSFVFGWASEWVCFLGEIVALLVYFYGWKRLTRSQHLAVGWLYFIFAWLSLFLVNGIIAFMLTPGEWLNTKDFWDGFFNPSFLSSLFFRSFLCFMLAGLFGFVTATRIADPEARKTMVRTCALWTLAPFALFLLCGWWYVAALPEPQYSMVVAKSHRVVGFFRYFWIFAPLVVLGGLLMAVRMPRSVGFPLAFLILALGLGLSGSFEFIRESGRKPFLIYAHIYSNSVLTAEAADINEQGALKRAKWVPDSLDPAGDALEAGQWLYQLQCANCHSIDGPLNDILPRTAKFTLTGMDAMLDGLGKVNRYMPPFVGTVEERMALAAYIVEGLHGKTDTGNVAFDGNDLPVDVAAFNPAPPEQGGDEYMIVTWNNLGMHCISDSDRNWILLPPANDLYAQLVQRGDPPSVITSGVTLSYKVEPGFENPSAHSEFWKFAHIIFGLDKPLPENIGLAGKGLSGEMDLQEAEGWFEAKLIPVVPYPDSGGYMPFPLFTIEARDADGKLLASTQVVAPTATEMGCKNCHGGPWKVDNLAGISNETGRDVLTVHDRMNGTDLAARAEAGKPVLCQSCHPDPVLGAKGNPELLNLPAALHGLHAQYLSDRGSESCAYCHPNRPDGPTRCLRGRHADMVGCVDCHGTLEDHALSLLKAEEGKKGRDMLMANLKPRMVESVDAINGRTPWLGEPDCLNCHQGFANPGLDAFNTWTEGGEALYRNRHDDMGAIACAGCHNSPHAVYPASNIYGQDRDNIPPLQYQGEAGTMGTGGGCICHSVTPDFSAHHENQLR